MNISKEAIWVYLMYLLETGIFIYALLIMFSYLLIMLVSALAVRDYMHKSRFMDFDQIARSPLSPSIALIAPAYNEGLNIVENIRSLMAVQYPYYQVIIVNDGSKDDSMEKAINAFDLVKVPCFVDEKIKTKPIRGIYKSKNKRYKKLLLVDKENGGKADALNVGLNIAEASLVACIDVDCILEQDALLKMVQPFIDADPKKKVIATGGVVRIANSCTIEDGKLVHVEVPKNYWARVQVLEYIRAFLLGRMGWSKMNGLLLISGAFGLFDRQIAIAAGGYNHATVGEDMELVVRMRRFMMERKLPYRVTYIPDPLCWTEAPASFNILKRQRSRWARGTYEVLWEHKKMFLNPKYSVVGLWSYPYWFFFEWLAPFIEFVGLLYFLFLLAFGLLNYKFFLLLLACVYGFAVCYSLMALVFEEYTYHQYKERKQFYKLLWVVVTEPFFYHPLTVYFAIKGNWDKLKGVKSWGEMNRQGLKK